MALSHGLQAARTIKLSRTNPLMKKAFTLVLSLALGLGYQASAVGTDCAPLGHLPVYTSDANNERKGAPELHEFDFHDFPVTDADPVTVKGKRATQKYQLKPGSEEPSPLEVVRNYKEQIGNLGATILFESKTEISAKLSKDGVETWMHVSCDGGFATNYTVVVVEKVPLKLTLTAPAADDYRLLGHMPGYTVTTSDKKSFDEFEFPVGGEATSKVQGKLFQFALAPTGRKEPPGDPEVIENYAAAIKAKGGELLVQSNTDLTGRMEDNGQQVWVKLRSLFGAVDLVVMEEKPFKATIEPQKAEAMKSALEKDGRMALHVNFEFAKSTLKPDAAPIIAQVVALLTANADYKVTIEGHTDNVGSAKANQTLSESRAAAVVEALVKGGIAKERLTSAGFGAAQPVASNDTGDGRAKNRRVELVKQ